MKHLTAIAVTAIVALLIIYGYITGDSVVAWSAAIYLLVDYSVSKLKNDTMCSVLRIFLFIPVLVSTWIVFKFGHQEIFQTI